VEGGLDEFLFGLLHISWELLVSPWEALLDDLTEVDVDVVGEPRSEVETGSEANIDCPSVEVFVVDFFWDLVDSATELTFFVGEGIY
jgi:hypothetical protein